MAGRWYEEHGAVDDALRHALAADDPEWSGDLLERHFDALYLGSRGATVERWLSALPEGLVDSRPRLLLARARMAYLGGEVETAGDLLDSAERALEAREGSVDTMVSSPPNEVAATIAVERAIIANQRGDPDAGARFASEALGEVGDGQSMVGSLARWQLGLSDWLRGRLIDASSSLDSSARHWEQQGDLTLAAWSCQYRGQVLRARGDLDSAVHVCRKALDVASPPGRTPHPAAGVAHVGMAEVAYERAELDAAERHLADGLPLCRRFVYNQPLAIGWATQARIRQAREDPAGARSAMEQAQEIADPGVADVLTPVMALRARLMLAQGHSAAVAAWTSERQLDAEDRFEYPQEAAYLVLLRLLLARKEIDAALHLADRLHASALSQDRSGSLIEIQALRALGLAASGDETAALSELAGAFTLAAPQGYVRVFIDEGWPMAELLGRFIAAHSRAGADVPPEYLGLLVRNFERAAGDDDAAPVVPELVVQLSSRELEVLGKVAEDMTNREIADELYVSLHTVKKHITHILEKLGASNRTEATTRARELGLVA